MNDQPSRYFRPRALMIAGWLASIVTALWLCVLAGMLAFRWWTT